MTSRLLLSAAALALSASLASAQGINLSWNDCGAAGLSNLTWECNSNTGLPFTMIASFIPPPGVDNFLGVSSQIDIFTSQSTLPDWWKHGNTSLCRGTTGLTITFDFTSGPFTCTDFYTGNAAGGFAYDVGFSSALRARLRVQLAVPIDLKGAVSPSQEYYAYKVNLLRGKSSGTGSCAGCTTSACIVLNDIQLFQPPDALFDPDIFNPALSNYITWQLPVSGPPGCPLATPTHEATWGQVKSLYR